MRALVLAILALLAVASAPAAQAETLLVERARAAQPLARPLRGMTMAQVQARFGAPAERLDPRGGQKRDWPTIHRWVYPAYTVYFERSKVINVVLNQASPAEVAPVPAPPQAQ